MNSRNKNILLATVRVAVAATTAFLFWIGDMFLLILRAHSQSPEPEKNQDFQVVIEDGCLKTKCGDFEAIMEILDDPRNEG